MLVTRLIVSALLAVLAACTPSEAPQQRVPTAESTAMERWQALETELSNLRVFIQSRIEFHESRGTTLSEADRVNLTAASAAIAEMESMWRSASTDFLSGDVGGAVELGQKARSKAREALKLLGIDPGNP